ncbi:asparagine synthetase [Methylocaldum marinum]|uniref:asparagine synthase (glutamine-hydrolyzing) n=1 Tax=Methylocaldum marinum TaxID=1432792 RepID=A0A286P444_9GAMM|nr:asparagine synthase-related protein [Methylocaldum marinum]BBA32416.1 asparagine synthetase [Methylocaldum marinum]
MSGICGWINNRLPPQDMEETLEKMSRQLCINPTHNSKKTVHAAGGFAALGLPTQIGSYTNGSIVTVFHGRPRWTLPDLARAAERHDHAYALCEAYAKHGAGLLQHLHGSFSLAIVDIEKRNALLAIDRMGISPLYYSSRNGQLIFGSDARSVTVHPDALSQVDNQAIFDYLYFHMVPSPRSVFAGQEKLLPGQCVMLKDRNVEATFYWKPVFSENKTPVGQLATAFREKLTAAVSSSLDGSKTGAFLSGGTDSSTVSGLFRKIAGEPVDTYSIGFQADGFDETEFARIAAKHFSLRAHEYYMTPQDVAEAIPQIARAYDEPFGNASAVAAFFCAKQARADGIETLLAGDGGDELFGGNVRYAKQKVFEFYHLVPGALRRSMIEPAVFGFPLGAKILPVAKAQSYIRQARIPLPGRLETYNFLNRFPLADIFAEEFLASVDIEAPSMNSDEVYRRAEAATSVNRMLFMDWKLTLADNDLRKVNRMCELAGVEARYPMLDDDLVAFSTEVPSCLKVKGLKLRYLFKEALKDFLPQEIIKKSKHGFGLPFGIWMNEYKPLMEISHESLSRLSKRGYIKPAFIESLLAEYREFPSYYGVMIWVLVMLEQWLSAKNAQ